MPDRRASSLTTIDAILNSRIGPRFFEDDRVRWRHGRKNRPGKTMAKADSELRNLVNLLRRLGQRDDDALDLADKLAGCSTEEPCVSGACPRCGLAAQRLMVHAARRLIRRDDGDWVMVTAVHARSIIRCGDLADHDPFEPLRRQARRALREVRARAFGGLELSANEHQRGLFQPHYAPHFHIFGRADKMRRGEDLFRAHFPAMRWTPQPVVIKDFDKRSRGLAYAVKPDLHRRDTLTRRVKSDGTLSGYSTRVKPIRQPERLELALALDQAGLDARVFLHGFALVVRNDAVELVPTRS